MFAQRNQSVTRWQTVGDDVSVDIAYRGKLAQDVPGGPAAGTELELAGVSEFGFADGKISRIVDRS